MCLTLHLDNKRFLCLFVKFVLYRGPVLCEKHRISFFNFPLPSIRLSICLPCVPCALKRFPRTSATNLQRPHLRQARSSDSRLNRTRPRPVKIVPDYQSVTKSTVAASRRSTLARPGRGETSGGSLRSSRQAVA